MAGRGKVQCAKDPKDRIHMIVYTRAKAASSLDFKKGYILELAFTCYEECEVGFPPAPTRLPYPHYIPLLFESFANEHMMPGRCFKNKCMWEDQNIIEVVVS
jgi:hypothetical protein